MVFQNTALAYLSLKDKANALVHAQASLAIVTAVYGSQHHETQRARKLLASAEKGVTPTDRTCILM